MFVDTTGMSGISEFGFCLFLFLAYNGVQRRQKYKEASSNSGFWYLGNMQGSV